MLRAARSVRLAIIAGLLIPTLAVFTPAAAQPNPDPSPGQDAALLEDPGLTLAANTIYFPWVANDDDFGLGPADTSITVQNLEDLDTYIYIYKGTGAGWELSTTAYLAAWASKTFTADSLGFASGEGAPVAVSAYRGGLCVTDLGPGGMLSAGRDSNGNGRCTDYEVVVTLFDEVPADQQVDVCVATTSTGATAPYWDSAAGLYVSWDDVEDLEARQLAGGQFGGLNNDGDCSDAEGGLEAEPSVIGGVAKTAVDGETLPFTTTADSAVSGYTALNGLELDRFDQWYLPIVQTNCGPGGCWDSVIRAANYATTNSAITLRFFPSDDGSGSLQTGFQLEFLVNAGATIDVVLSDYVPEGWVGSVHAYSDSEMMLMADRFKVGYHMWLTNTGSSADFEWFAQVPGGLGNYVLFAPDVRIDYFGWNTGINIANLVEMDNNVTAQYFNLFGNATGTRSQRLAPHGMTYFYDPSVAGQNDSDQPPGLDFNAGVVGSALIWSDYPVAVAVDATKYPETTTAGDQQVFQGTSYSATANVYTWQSVALVQKGNPATGMGATSGINMMNPNAVAAQALVYWINQSGFGADNFGTTGLAIPGFANGFVYTLAQHNLPNGFYGAAVVTSTYGIVATSANVDYQVQYDGSVLWNAFNPCGLYRGPDPAQNCYLGDPFQQPEGGSVKKLYIDEAGDEVVGVPAHLYNETAYQRFVLGNPDYPGIPWDANGWSDINGEILWTNVPPGDYWLVTTDLSAEGYAGIASASGAALLGPWLETFTLVAGQDLVLTNTLETGQAIKTVRTNLPANGPVDGTDGIYSGVYIFPDLNGNGQFEPEDLGFAPGATVSAAEFYAAAIAAGVLNAAGEVAFPLPPGSYLALVDALGYAPRWEGFELDTNEQELNILDVGEPGTLRLLVESSGVAPQRERALAQSGQAITGAQVRVYAALPFSELNDEATWGELVAEGETGPDGLFVTDLQPGEYVVCAEGPVDGDIQYAERCIFVTILAGQTANAVIDLGVTPWLNGVVRDALTDAPIVGATVTVSQGGQVLWTGQTDDLGEFTVTAADGLTDGTVRFEVTAFNYAAIDESDGYQAAVDVLDGYLMDQPTIGEGTYDTTLLLGFTTAEVSIFGQVDCNSDDTVDDPTVNTLANTNASCSNIPSPTAVGDDTAGQPFGGLNVTGSEILVFDIANPLPTDTPLFTRAIVPPTGGNTFSVTAGQSYSFCIFYEEDGDGVVGGTGDEDFVCTAFIQVDETGYSNAADKLTLHLLGSTRVVSTDPADGATNVSVEQVITITFNRPAEIASAAAFSVECPSGTPIGFTVTSPAVLPATSTSFTLTPAGPLPEGVTCTVTVFSSQVPDMLADYSFAFTTNTAPFVQSTNPLDGATNVATNQVVTIVFSEPVDAAAGAFTWECPVGSPITFTANPALPATNATMYELTPSAALPEGVTCTVTVLASGIAATDGVPPASMAADYVFTFTTDQAPTVLSTTPADGSGVGPDSLITIQFSEPVNVTATAFDLQCPVGTPVALTIDPAAPGGVADYTLTPTGGLPAGELCTMTVVAAQVTDADSGDPPNNMAADYVFSFNVDAPPAVESTAPADGATGVAVDANIDITFTEPVNVTATAFELECPVGAAQTFTVNPAPPGGVATFTLDPTADLPEATVCTVTVVADQVSDVDTVDPPDNMLANYVFSFTTTDPAPTVVSTLPVEGGGIGPDGTITIEFSEPVNVTTSAFELECPVGTPLALGIAPAPPGGVTTFTLTPTNPLPAGASCVLTVVADQVSDADTVDPPDNMAADFVLNFNVDAPPDVDSTTPANGATDVAVDAVISITFTEPVNVTAAAFTLECPIGSAVAFTNTTGLGPATTFTLDPNVDLPNGVECTVTVVAAEVTDDDATDPPNTMLADYIFSFTTVDLAPTVLSTNPLDGATDVPVNTDITITFSEPVNVTASAFTLECPVGSAQTFAVNPAPPGGVASFTLDPTVDLPGGVTCTVTVVATEVSDADPVDPPDTMVTDYVFTFSTDEPPTVTSTDPVDGADDVLPDVVITINFSESVNATTASFTIECPDGTTPLTYTLSASPAASFTLTPDADLPAGETCTVTVIANQITDADSNDPPDNMAADYVFSFSIPLVAADLTYAPTIVGNVGINTANSTQYSVITENGVTGVTAAVVSGTTANGGQVVMNAATGTFSYNPPAGFTGTDTFDYTLTGGSGTSAPGTVSLTVAGMVWFVNNTAAAGGDGRLSNPFNCLVGGGSCLVAGSGLSRGAAGHAIFIYTGGGNYTAGLTLLDMQRLIGQGTSQAFAAATGLTFPADVVTLPVTGGADPVLTTSNVDAVQLTNPSTASWIMGLTIGDTGTGYAISGTNFGSGTLNVADVTIMGTGGALNLSTGTLAATFDSITSTGSANVGINLTSVGGTLTVTGATSFTNVSNQGLNLSNSSVVITMASLTVSGATSGINMQNQSGVVTINGGAISGTTGNAVNISTGNANFTYAGSITNTTATAFAVRLVNRGTGTVTFSGNISDTGLGITVIGSNGATVVFSGSSKVLNTGANPAVTLDNNATSTISFTNGGLDIDTNGALGFSATTAGTVVVSGSGNSITAVSAAALLLNAVSVGAGDILFDSVSSSNGGSGPAVQFVAVGGTGELITITTLTISSTSSGMDGVDIDNVAANVVITGGSITGAAGIDFDVNSGAGTVSYGGTITNTSNRSVEVTNRTGSAATSFSGAISDNGGTGIFINNNAAGTSVSFTGTLTLSTGASDAFTATNGGSVSASAAASTVTTTTGVAINIANVTIAAANVIFQSVNTSGSSANAIILNTTGSSGGLRVTGTGTTAGSGGTIANKTNAILLTSTSGPTFNFMNINTSSASAIVMRTTTSLAMTGTVINTTGFHAIFGGEAGGGQNVNLTLVSVQILNAGDAANEDAMYFANSSQTNLTGTVSITDSVFQTFFSNAFDLYNNSGTAGITVSNSDFSDSDETNGGTAIQIQSAGSSTTTLTVGNGSLFDDLRIDGIFANALDAASTVTVNVSGSTFEDGVVAGGIIAGGGITLASNNGDTNFNVSGNLFQRLGPAFQVLNDKDGVMNGTFFDNDILDPGVSPNVTVRAEGGSGSGAISTTVDINQNTIEGPGGAQVNGAHGIRAINRGLGNVAGVMNLTIRNNTIGSVGNEIADEGLFFDFFDDAETYVHLSNNIVRALSTNIALDSLVYDDADPPLATIGALTMENNQFFGNAGNTVFVGTDEPAQFCLDIRNNAATGGTITLDNAGGTYVVEGAGTGAVTPAAITALGNTGTVVVTGTINFNNGAQCQMPALPSF